MGTYSNAAGVCVPDTECQRKLCGRSLAIKMNHLCIFSSAASCTGGQEFSATGGEVCQCGSTGLMCIDDDSPACYCPEGSFVDSDGSCSLQSSCSCK